MLLRQTSDSFMSSVTTRSVAKYALLPGIFPRFRHLAFSFSSFLHFFVQLLGTAGLIDRNHPCMRPENAGQYRLTDIIGLAYHNLSFTRENIPKIVMFFTVVMTLVLMVIVGTLLLLQFASHYNIAAQAQYFDTPKAADGIMYSDNIDWAFRFLERVFGNDSDTGLSFWIQGNVGGDAQGNPWFRVLLMQMLKGYSGALMIIAVFMVIYLIVITVAEAARTGRPFGERFDSVWAPIRLALALGLLLPISGDAKYSGAQLVVFQVAEMGSNLATNTWFAAIKQFKPECTDVTDPVMKQECEAGKRLVVPSSMDPGYRFVRDMFMVNLCNYGYNLLLFTGVIAETGAKDIVSQKYTQQKDNDIISYGSKRAPAFCGKIKVGKSIPIPPSYLTTGKNGTVNNQPGATPLGTVDHTVNNFWPNKLIAGYSAAYQNFYQPGMTQPEFARYVVSYALCNRDLDMSELEKNFRDYKTGAKTDPEGTVTADPTFTDEPLIQKWVFDYWKLAFGRDARSNNPALDTYFGSEEMREAVDAYNDWILYSMRKDAANGWASAGVFYLRISQAMAALSKAMSNQPTVLSLPLNLQRPYATPGEPKLTQEEAQDRCSGWFSSWWNSDMCETLTGAAMLHNVLDVANGWFVSSVKSDPALYEKLGGSSWDDALFLQDPDDPTNPSGRGRRLVRAIMSVLEDSVMVQKGGDLHPLGQVISWGDTLMSVALACYAISIAFSMPFFGSSGIGLIGSTLGNLLFVPGFTLAFIVPTLPFIYFTFGVLEWIICVLEAAIGMPLMALSLITLEGDVVGKAMQSVKILFELILRPTILIMSLICAILIFSASIEFINDSVKLFMGSYLSLNGVGAGTGMVASLGMLLIYMLIIYSVAVSSFKLIDAIPNAFGRWIDMASGGAGFQVFKRNQITDLLVAGAYFNEVQQIGGAAKSAMDNAYKNKQADQASKDKIDKDDAAAAAERRQRDLSHREYNDLLNDIAAGLAARGPGFGGPIPPAPGAGGAGAGPIPPAPGAGGGGGGPIPPAPGAGGAGGGPIPPAPGVGGAGSGFTPFPAGGGTTPTNNKPGSGWSNRLGGDYIPFEDATDSNSSSSTAPSSGIKPKNADSSSKDIENAEDEIAKQKKELKDKEKEIKDLEKRIKDLEDKLNDKGIF